MHIFQSVFLSMPLTLDLFIYETILLFSAITRDIHKRYVMYQLLNATNFIHSGNVIHRDMKPSNVLVDSKCR